MLLREGISLDEFSGEASITLRDGAFVEIIGFTTVKEETFVEMMGESLSLMKLFSSCFCSALSWSLLGFWVELLFVSKRRCEEVRKSSECSDDLSSDSLRTSGPKSILASFSTCTFDKSKSIFASNLLPHVKSLVLILSPDCISGTGGNSRGLYSSSSIKFFMPGNDFARSPIVFLYNSLTLLFDFEHCVNLRAFSAETYKMKHQNGERDHEYTKQQLQNVYNQLSDGRTKKNLKVYRNTEIII